MENSPQVGYDANMAVPAPDRDPAATNKTPPNPPKRSKGTPRGIFKGGECDKCASKETGEGVNCLFCKELYHGIKCNPDERFNCFPKHSFVNTYKPAVNNENNWEKRPGNVKFVCDICLTKFETNRAESFDNKIDRMDSRISTLANGLASLKSVITTLVSTLTDKTNSAPPPPPDDSLDRLDRKIDSFNTELLNVKNLVTELPNSISEKQSEPSHTGTPQNPWNDSNRVKQLLTVKSTDSPVDQNQIGSILAKNGVQFNKTFVSKGTAKIVLPSSEAAAKAMEILDKEIPSSEISKVKGRLPTINVVGLPSSVDDSTLTQDWITLNPAIASAVDLDVDTDEKSLEILAIRPLKNNDKLQRANVRVSNNVRLAIHKQGDRIYTEHGSLKVYDNFFVRRCFKCQGFGHNADDCRSNNHVCGTCAGNHETKGCKSRNTCCVNCKNQGLDHNHTAFSTTCHCYVREQSRMKNATPFHQRI